MYKGSLKHGDGRAARHQDSRAARLLALPARTDLSTVAMLAVRSWMRRLSEVLKTCALHWEAGRSRE